MLLVAAGGGFGQGRRAADDLADLLGDLGLAGRVGLPGQALDQGLGVVGRRLHGPLSAGQLGGGRLQQAGVDPAGHVERQQLVQHRLGVGLEVVQRVQLGPVGGLLPPRPPAAAAG